MKVWLIYKKIPCLRPILYGFTDKKKILKLFEKQYNMNRFSIVNHDISKEEWYKLNQQHGNCILRVRGLTTLDSFHNECTVDVVMPEYDDLQLIIESDRILDYIYEPLKTIRDYSHLIQPEILNSLGILWSKKVNWKDIKVDQLALYILMNENYMKGGESLVD